jgi:hypothetical protein
MVGKLKSHSCDMPDGIFRRAETLPAPSTTETVTIAFTLPDDALYRAEFVSWVLFMADPTNWYQLEGSDGLEPREMAAIWGDVLVSEVRT